MLERASHIHCVLSTLKPPRLAIEFAAALEIERFTSLLTACSIPAYASAILESIVRMSPGSRTILEIGIDGCIGLQISKSVATTTGLALATAVGSNPTTGLFDHLSRMDSDFGGFCCAASAAGQVTFSLLAYPQPDSVGIAKEWNCLMVALGVRGQVLPIDEIMLFADMHSVGMSLGYELTGEDGIAVSLGCLDFPIKGASDALQLITAEHASLELACEIAAARKQSVFRSIDIRQVPRGRREVCFHVDLEDEAHSMRAIGGHSTGLVAGVRLILPVEGDHLRETRLWLSEGTTSPPMLSADGPDYRAGATVPRLPWHRPASEEQHVLLGAEAPASERNWLAIVRLPPEFMNCFEVLRLGDLETLEQVEAIRRNPEMPSALVAAANLLSTTYSDVGSDVTCLGISAQRPGQQTVSFDHGLQRRVGLHIDTWDDADGDTQHRVCGRNILLANLGATDRYFLYLNISVDAMERLLPGTDLDANRLAERFLRSYSRYPVAKVRVAPGEAYIAPVQSILHDGSTAGTRHLDVHVAFLGRFRARNFAGDT
ncbi:hypothetical protein [Cupriavidus sp. DF5525]|uniref:hypothetical protein n=1 Tax=Cupriavidus sp. DF5525 TaxID=3160989 RepID=UPI0032E02A69